MKFKIIVAVSGVLFVITLILLICSFVINKPATQCLPMGNIWISSTWDGPFPSLAVFDSYGCFIGRYSTRDDLWFYERHMPEKEFIFNKCGIYLNVMTWPWGEPSMNGKRENWTFLINIFYLLFIFAITPAIMHAKIRSDNNIAAANKQIQAIGASAPQPDL
jgi:hypothetical protein